MNTRPPIVAVMGHVDHGKTTLLDYIRKTAVAEREAGGITQSIGAYEITHPPAGGRKITFIDTPGHEAFSNMRAYGAKVADIAILVVAADDGVKPQTKDALIHIRAEKIPFVVAINKIDKPNADTEKTKNDLAQAEVFLEGRGGNISFQEISAKQGTGVSELLDHILLVAEVEDIKEETPHGCASGIVTSARLDPRRGIIVGGIIRGGTLAQGNTIGTISASGKVRTLENFLGKQEKELKPSAPCAIIGFESLPKIGEQFFAGSDAMAVEKAVAEDNAKIKTTKAQQKARTEVEGEEIIPLVLKADESASLEALEGLIQKLSAALPLVVVGASVGDIHETDLKNTEHAAAVIIGFHVKIDKAAHNVSDARKIPIISSNIIYELEKELVAYASKAVSKVLPSMLILAVFGGRKGRQQIIGGRVLVGPVKNQSAFEMWHEKRKICAGRILNMQSERKDIAEANAGQEIGLSVESDEPIKVGNTLIFE
ncbi:MAG: GTP-binding protein [Candidatus Jorgensenbacteria bacterium]|nr:GTP-binding protein [Candidatus Jorgensenbacteria bacterium]